MIGRPSRETCTPAPWRPPRPRADPALLCAHGLGNLFTHDRSNGHHAHRNGADQDAVTDHDLRGAVASGSFPYPAARSVGPVARMATHSLA